MWAFGVVLWETFSQGCDPYPAWGNAKVFQEVKRGFRLARPEYSQFPEEKPMDTIYKVSKPIWVKFLMLISFVERQNRVAHSSGR